MRIRGRTAIAGYPRKKEEKTFLSINIKDVYRTFLGILNGERIYEQIVLF